MLVTSLTWNGNHLPADNGLQNSDVRNSNRGDYRSDYSERTDSEQYMIGPAKRHAEKLFRDLLSKKCQKRRQIAAEVVDKLFAIEAV